MGIKKELRKMMKKELKKHDKKMAKGNKLIKVFMKEFMEYKAKAIGYLEPIFMANVDYPVDDFSAIAYVDASFSDYDRFGSIGIVMLTRTEVIQYSEIPKDLHPSALTSTNHELIAAAKAIEMAKEKHIKRLIIKYDNAAYIVSDGYNEKFSSLNASYLIKWQMISDYNQQGLKYLNMNAVVGEFEKKNQYSGLNEMKLGFNTIVTEYIGEFDLILNNFTYNLFKSFNKEK